MEPLQVYLVLIASLLINLWIGQAPTKRTYELLCFYLSGWTTTQEVIPMSIARISLPLLGKQ